MLKEYVLHRRIFLEGGGPFCSYLCSSNSAQRPWFKWEGGGGGVNRCFFCLKKRLYAVKSVHLLHPSPL